MIMDHNFLNYYFQQLTNRKVKVWNRSNILYTGFYGPFLIKVSFIRIMYAVIHHCVYVSVSGDSVTLCMSVIQNEVGRIEIVVLLLNPFLLGHL